MAQTKKSIISFVILLTIAGGLVFPQVANAGIGDWILRGFIKAMAIVPLGLSKLASNITHAFLTWITSPDAIKVSYTPKPGKPDNNPVVEAGWRVTRDLANMMIVLGFVVVGIATILRLREYEAQKLLAPLIIVAILINFSPLLCGLVIDASNITMNFFLKGNPNSNILGTFYEQWNDVWNAKDSPNALSMSIGYILGNGIACIVFGLLFFLFIARYIMLWMLVIASPLAFACYVFGFTKKYFQQWWNEFLKWCIMGIPAAFTLYLASVAGKITLGNVPTWADSVDINIIQKLLTFSLPAMILLVGFFYTLKISGAGAAVAIGAAAAVGGLALGAVKKAGSVAGGAAAGMAKKGARSAMGTAAEKTHLAGAGGKISSAVGTAMERIGLRETGTTAQKMAKGREEAKKKIKDLKPDRLARVAESSGESGAKRAAAAELLAEKGDFGKITEAKRPAVYARAMSQGVPPSVLEKADPTLAKYNTKTVGDHIKRITTAQPGIKPAAARQQAEQMAIRESVQRLDTPAVRKLSSDTLKDANVTSNLTAKQAKAFERGTPAQIREVKGKLPTIRARILASYKAGDVQEARRLNALRNQIMAL